MDHYKNNKTLIILRFKIKMEILRKSNKWIIKLIN